MGGCVWGFDNALAYATLAAGSATPDRPVTNLRVPIGAASLSWQTASGALTSADGAWFTLDALSAAQRWQAFALTCTNLTSLAVVRWRVGPADAIIPETPAVSLSFDENFSAPAGTWTFTRSTVSWRRRSDGTWTEAAAHTPAIHHAPETMECLGALILRAAIANQIRNSRLEGAVVGTPGTPPTNCSIVGGSGLSTEIVAASASEDGLPAFDLRVFGTASGAGTVTFQLEDGGTIAAVNGDTVGQAIHLRSVAGDLTNISDIRFGHSEGDGTTVLRSNFRSISPDGTRLGEQRYEYAVTLSGGPTVAFVRPYLQFVIAGAGPVDLTLRIAVPLLHKGLGTMVCPLPVTAPVGAPGAFTRQVDSLTYVPADALMVDGATTCFLRMALLASNGNVVGAIQIDDGTNNNRIVFRPIISGGLGSTDWLVTVGGVNLVDTPSLNSSAVPGRLVNHVAAMSPSSGFTRWNDDAAAQAYPDSVGGLTTVRMTGSTFTTIVAVREIRIYPRRLTDGQCVQLVTDGTTLDPATATFDSGFVTDLVRFPARKAVIAAPAEVGGRYARCDIHDPANPAGFVAIGLAYAGPVWLPQVGVSFESVFAPEVGEDRAATRGGQEHITPRWRRHTWDVAMPFITQADFRAQQQRLEAMAATGANILFVPDYGDLEGVKRNTIFGLLESTAPVGFAEHSLDRTWRGRITDRL